MKLRTLQPDRAPLPKAAEMVNYTEQSGHGIDLDKEMESLGWDKVAAAVQEIKLLSGSFGEVGLAANVIRVFPEHKTELSVSDKAWQGSLEWLQQDRDKKEWREFLLIASRMLFTAPERRDDLKLDEDLFAEILEWIERLSRTSYGQSLHCAVLSDLFVVFPKYRDRVTLDEGVWNTAVREVRESQEINPIVYSESLVKVAIIFPDRRQELGVDQSDWATFQAELERTKAERFDSYILLLGNLVFFTADHINITEQGVELVRNKSLEQSPELPVRKIA